MAISHNAKFIVWGGEHKVLIFSNRVNGKIIRIFRGHSEAIRCVKFALCDKQIISGACDHSIKLWCVLNGSVKITLEDHSETVLSAVVSNNGKNIISAGCDITIRVWDIENKK